MAESNTAPMGQELPPLPPHIEVGGEGWGLEDFQSWKTFTVDALEQYASEAIAPYAERIRHLERELAEAYAKGYDDGHIAGREKGRIAGKRELAEVKQPLTTGATIKESLQVGELAERKPASIGGDSEFCAILSRYNQGEMTEAQFIAYIDGRSARTAPADPFVGQRFLNWNRSQDKPPVAIGKELGVARKVMEFAAAPTPTTAEDK